MTEDPRRLAKDVARQLDRRRTGRRLAGLLALAAVIAAIVLFFRFGLGAGRGAGEGPGAGPGPGSGSARALVAPTTTPPCRVRVTGEGLRLDGGAATREQILASCERAGAADVVVTGDARQGDWDELKVALEAADVRIDLTSRSPAP